MRFLIGWAFDTYINFWWCIGEFFDRAMDVWGDDDE